MKKNNEESSLIHMQYEQIEQGKLEGNSGARFLKYQGIHSTNDDKQQKRRVLTMKEWADVLFNDYESFNDILASCPFEAFFWECAPTTDGSNRMEFVLVDSTALAQFARAAPDRMTFRHYFRSPSLEHEPTVAVFPSLGKDALLLAPTTQSREPFTDIAYFARHASATQQKNIYQQLAQLVQEKLQNNEAPFWLSTSGMGIAWMHIRLDDRPKYYTYKPFQTML